MSEVIGATGSAGFKGYSVGSNPYLWLITDEGRLMVNWDFLADMQEKGNFDLTYAGRWDSTIERREQ